MLRYPPRESVVPLLRRQTCAGVLPAGGDLTRRPSSHQSPLPVGLRSRSAAWARRQFYEDGNGLSGVRGPSHIGVRSQSFPYPRAVSLREALCQSPFVRSVTQAVPAPENALPLGWSGSASPRCRAAHSRRPPRKVDLRVLLQACCRRLR